MKFYNVFERQNVINPVKPQKNGLAILLAIKIFLLVQRISSAIDLFVVSKFYSRGDQLKFVKEELHSFSKFPLLAAIFLLRQILSFTHATSFFGEKYNQLTFGES